jgi:hypothetical protein
MIALRSKHAEASPEKITADKVGLLGTIAAMLRNGRRDLHIINWALDEGIDEPISPTLEALHLAKSGRFDGEGRVGRVEYSKATASDFRYVIYDRGASGESFADREPDEVRWFDFEPDEEERQAARVLLLLGWSGNDIWLHDMIGILRHLRAGEETGRAAA